MDQIRRGNYDSGQDYVLEYGELRFTFNERDFSERVEQAGRKLGFVGGRLRGAPSSRTSSTSPSTARWPTRPPRSASTSTTAGPSSSARPTAASCTGCAGSSSAPPGSTSASRRASWTWSFDDITHTFGYVQPERDREPIELSPEPNWRRVAYGGRR